MKKKIMILALIFASAFASYGTYRDNTAAVMPVDNLPKVSVGGESFGVKFYTNGDVIVKIDDNSPAKIAGLKVDDIIKEINGEKILSNEQVRKIIENSGGKMLNFKICRNNEYKNFKIKPQKNANGVYKTGLWIKDSCAGIGTITYYDNESDVFVGLGHGICDSYTSTLLPLSYGEISYATVTSVDKSKNGSPGGLNGYFDEDIIGSAFMNSQNGLFCTLYKDINKKEYRISSKREIEKGGAKLITSVSGNCAKSYDIEITSVNYLGLGSSSDFEIEIKDKELLGITGGIVQGMSGSPIIQNNKLVGAVTHVFINDPKKGYGVSAEKMYNNYIKYKSNSEKIKQS